MPKQYEAMRDKFQRQGMTAKAAKTKAAKIYNAHHKQKMGRYGVKGKEK